MFKRLRTGSIAGSAALVLVMALSGIAMGAPLASDEEPAGPAIVDVNGDGIDDTCQVDVVEDAAAAEAAFDAADANGDGTISVSEAAQSGWVGGANCNHGGYVSAVARADDACATDDEGSEEEPVVEPTEGTTDEQVDDEDGDCEDEAEDEEEDEEEETEPADDAACEAVAVPEPETPLDLTVSNWHGAWMRWVAQSDAVGGKNCNHGGAVSEAAKKDQEAAAAAREARKAERAAERDLRAQEREAAKAARSADKGKGKGKGH